ncbi:heparinase II/III-family protein [bacterium]|nr:heparinase II/III-family protein [bacterium]
MRWLYPSARKPLALVLIVLALAAMARAQGSVDVSPLMKMSIDEVVAQVPSAAGFMFIGCPKCDGGSQEAGVLGWHYGIGDTLRCRYCGATFPSAQYPNNKEKRITAPDGSVQIYRYYEAPNGRQYFFEAHAWFERTMWLRKSADALAQKYAATGDLASADRAAAILARFAQVVPNYAVKYDMPYRPKKFFPADQKWPYAGIDVYRGSKFDWWAFQDIPEDLTSAYDTLKKKNYDFKRLGGKFGPDPDALIQKDLFRLIVDFTAANPEQYHNMSPRMYRAMILVGRAINEPKYVHDAVDRFRGLVERSLFADGWWKEGSPSYHSQTVNSMAKTADVARGYSDPPSWTGEKFTNLDLMTMVPLLVKAQQVRREAVLPNGRMIPINDTWSNNYVEPTNVSQSRLWPSVGQALLGAGRGDSQICLGLNWSGNYGHSHMDNGSIFLYAFSGELLPDIGYTHTRWRNWAVNSASHNLVVVDERSQAETGPRKETTQGNLLWFDAKDDHVKSIDLDASPSYPDVKTYRRRIALVHAAEGFDYVIDRFDVSGGKTHDLFLNGSADEKPRLETSVALNSKVAALVPSWGKAGNYVGENDIDYIGKKFHAYGFLRDIGSAAVNDGWTATWRYNGSGLRAHMIAPAGSTAYRYTSPMIRPAGKNDADLPKYMTNGIMQRHAGPESTFVTVYEPFRNQTWIENVKNDGDKLAVVYGLNGKRVTDTVVFGTDSISIMSSAGWSYQTGKPIGGSVTGLETIGGKSVMKLDKKAPAASAVRLTIGKRSFVFPVAKSAGNTLELADDAGLVMDSPESLRYTAFPHDTLKGRITWTAYTR